jgi:predicted nuclease with TOPRIM domain
MSRKEIKANKVNVGTMWTHFTVYPTIKTVYRNFNTRCLRSSANQKNICNFTESNINIKYRDMEEKIQIEVTAEKLFELKAMCDLLCERLESIMKENESLKLNEYFRVLHDKVERLYL